jgi:hypothetical protein
LRRPRPSGVFLFSSQAKRLSTFLCPGIVGVTEPAGLLAKSTPRTEGSRGRRTAQQRSRHAGTGTVAGAHRNCSLWRSPPSSRRSSFRRLALSVAGVLAARPGALGHTGVVSSSPACCGVARPAEGSGGVMSCRLRFCPVNAQACRGADALLVCVEAELGVGRLPGAGCDLGVKKFSIERCLPF